MQCKRELTKKNTKEKFNNPVKILIVLWMHILQFKNYLSKLQDSWIHKLYEIRKYLL